MEKRTVMTRVGFSLVIALSLLMSGCKHDETIVSPPTENAAILALLNGQIDSWHWGSHRFVQMRYYTAPPSSELMICGRADIDEQGRFAFTSLLTPVNAWESKITEAVLDMTSLSVVQNNMICSDTSAKIIWPSIEIGCDSTIYQVGEIYRGSRSSEALARGQYQTHFWYLKQPVTVSGTIRLRQINGIAPITEGIFHYDLKFSQGWNPVVITLVDTSSYTEADGDVLRIEYSFTNIEPSPAHWICSWMNTSSKKSPAWSVAGK